MSFDPLEDDGNVSDLKKIEHKSRTIIATCQKLAQVGSEQHQNMLRNDPSNIKAQHANIVKENVAGMILMALLDRFYGPNIECIFAIEKLQKYAEEFSVYFESNDSGKITAKLLSKDEVKINDGCDDAQ